MRAQNKQQLLDFGQHEYHRLTELLSKLSPKQRDKEYIFDNRTAKDLVAHVYAWQLLELTWHNEGMAGEKPEIPAPGYTFKDAPKLNEKLYTDFSLISWDDLQTKFANSHNTLIQIIREYSDEELTTKKQYAWTGSTNMATYFASALSGHYVWGIDLIRKHFNIKI